MLAAWLCLCTVIEKYNYTMNVKSVDDSAGVTGVKLQSVISA